MRPRDPLQVGLQVGWSVGDVEITAVLDWWTANARELPWRSSRDVYAIWVSEVMSAQTTVTRAAEAWESWMSRWPTVQALATASLTEVLAEWQGLGYPRRARDLSRSARIVVETGWPEDLTELPGVGAYVAAAVRCFALEEPVLPLDVNVKRVLRRRFPGGVDTSADLARVIGYGSVSASAADHEAAMSLARDGLIVLSGTQLIAPE